MPRREGIFDPPTFAVTAIGPSAWHGSTQIILKDDLQRLQPHHAFYLMVEAHGLNSAEPGLVS